MSAAKDLERAELETIARIVDEVRRSHGDPAKGPVITNIEYTVDRDWSGEAAVHITITTADPADGREFFGLDELGPIDAQINQLFARHEIERIPYVVFQLQSEAEALANGTYYAED